MAKKSVSGTAQDPTIEFATVVIDDVLYKLVFSFNAIAEAESITGCNLLAGVNQLSSEGLNAMQFRGLLYAAMSVAQPDMTLEQVGSMIRLDTKDLLAVALQNAYVLSLPKKKREQLGLSTIDLEAIQAKSTN